VSTESKVILDHFDSSADDTLQVFFNAFGIFLKKKTARNFIKNLEHFDTQQEILLKF